MKRYPLNWIQWLTLFTALSLAVLMPFIVLKLEHGRRDTDDSIRTVLCYFESKALQSSILTARQKHQAVVIYAQALAQIDEPSCPLNS